MSDAMNSADTFSWVRRGRCYKLGHDVPHMGGVVPMRIVSEMRFDPKDIVPHLFEETDPGFHERCRPGDVIVTGRNFGMGPKMQGYIAMQALGLGLAGGSFAAGVAYAVTGDLWAALTLSLLEPSVQAGVYFFHERAWARHDEAAQAVAPGAPAVLH